MYALGGCALLWSGQSLRILSLTTLPPFPRFSTDFNTYPYILQLYILYVILLMRYHSLFFSLLPLVL
jgi:hypothetical protein